MRDPLWRLKTLPWITLLQNALLTVLVATLLDIALLAILTALLNSSPQAGGLALLGGGVGFMLLLLVAASGVGALSVILMERVFPQVLPDAATLWALVGCLALVLFLHNVLPIPAILVGFSRFQMVGLMMGLFAQGRPYWRR